MNLALWIIAIVPTVVFAANVLRKVFRGKEQLVASRVGRAQAFSPSTSRLIGIAEILGAIGLVLPAALKPKA